MVTGGQEGDGEVVACVFVGNAEASGDQFVGVVEEREVEAFVDAAEQQDKPSHSSGLEYALRGYFLTVLD